MQKDISFDVLDYEMVHWNSDGIFIAHKSNKITYVTKKFKKVIDIPLIYDGILKFCMPFRKLRRLLRLDKAMIIPTRIGLLMIRRNLIWLYNLTNEKWILSTTKLNCRNPMYNAVLRLDDGAIYIGEYGNPNGIGKRILRSKDDGLNWELMYQFKPDEIRHIHGLDWDPFEKKIWIFTGDADAESRILNTDIDFKEVTTVGHGRQTWRACHLLFTKNSVNWMMDSPLEEVHHIIYNRNNKTITIGNSFAGPVWFARKYKDIYLAASAQEIGPSHVDEDLHLYISKDLKKWQEIYKFKYDGWPKGYFRFGTITMARGDVPMLCCEGVEGIDGKTISLDILER